MAFREIELKNLDNEIEGIALVSPEDFVKVNKHNWHLVVSKRKYGDQNYAQGKVDGRLTMLHQFLMGRPPAEGLVIDHKNNNGLDNQRSNLRFVSKSINNQNVQKKQNASSVYLGVSKRKDKFVVMQGGTHIGVFEDELEAARHYDKYIAIKYNGAGRTNFPVPPENIEGVALVDLIVTKRKARTQQDEAETTTDI